MTTKELKAIYSAIWYAREMIEIFGSENYPYTDFKDSDLREMFYSLNDMAITITNKIDNERNY